MTKQSIKHTTYTFTPDEVKAILAAKVASYGAPNDLVKEGVLRNCELEFLLDGPHCESVVQLVKIVVKTLVDDGSE